jgi:hypothetical protein
VYERQRDWQQALGAYRQLARIKAAPPRMVAAHYLCELARWRWSAAIPGARGCCARRVQSSPFPRAALLRAQIAEREGSRVGGAAAAAGAHRIAGASAGGAAASAAPGGAGARDEVLAELVQQAESRDIGELKRVVFAAIAAGLVDARRCARRSKRCFRRMRRCRRCGGRDRCSTLRVAHEIGALLAQAEKYRCNECGFSGRNFTGIARPAIHGQLRGVCHRQAALR